MNKSIVLLRNRYLLAADLVITILSIPIAFGLRLPYGQLRQYLPTMAGMIVAALMVKPLVYWRFGLYRRFWAYASMKEALIILGAIAVNGILMMGYYFLSFYITQPRVPLTIPTIDALVSLVLVGGLRFSIRMLSELMQARRRLRGFHQQPAHHRVPLLTNRAQSLAASAYAVSSNALRILAS